MKKIFFSTIGILLFLNISFSQEPWTIEQCIEYALQNNIQIKRQELATEVSAKDLQQSKYQILPDLNGSIEHQFSSGRSLNTETYEWEMSDKEQGSLGIGSSLNIFNGLQNYNTIQRNKYNFLASKANFEKAKNDISLQIASAYLRILFDKEILNVAEQQLMVVNQQVERTSKLVEVGNVAKGELLRIKAQAANERVNKTNAENSLDISYLNLTQILDLDSAEGFEVYIPEIITPGQYEIPSVAVIYQEGLQQLPQITSAEYNVKAAEKDLAISKGMLSPRLSLSGYYTTRYTLGIMDPTNILNDWTFRDQLRDNQYKQVSISLDIPIFNKMAINTNIQKTRIALSDANFQLSLAQQQLYKEIQQARLDAIAALDKFESSQEAVNSNEEAYKYAEQKFNVGLFNTLEYNQAKNDLISAQSELLKAKYEYIFSIKILDFYRGIPIGL
ncbi:MAG: TolC family protein [Bacteroidales bacterium]|nr:TolC family protein [Bacteroidales bacterium]